MTQKLCHVAKATTKHKNLNYIY